VNPYAKLTIFLVATFFIVAQVGTADYTADDVATWKQWDWLKLCLGIGAALGMQVLAFVDKTFSSWQADKKLLAEKQERNLTL
jgi:hypothetical protein